MLNLWKQGHKKKWTLGLLLAMISHGGIGSPIELKKAAAGDREALESEAQKVSGGSGAGYDTEGWYRCPTDSKSKLSNLKSLLDIYPKTRDLGTKAITSTYLGAGAPPANDLSSHPAIHGVHYQDTFAFATTAPLDPWSAPY